MCKKTFVISMFIVSLIFLAITAHFNNKSLAITVPVSPVEVVQPDQGSNLQDNNQGQRVEPTDGAMADYNSYREVIGKTAGMIGDSNIYEMVQKYGLNILNVTWEDTGRYKGSCVGPNISDMTIQVQQFNPQTRSYEWTYMPVIRYDNFSDKTADISPEEFYLLVGNEKGKDLKAVTLKDFLKDITKYLNNPDGWKSQNTSLLAERDTHVLVSAQACFLPVPKEGKAEFNPFLFNYQSIPNDPAVLTILATREGTSVSVGGQCIYFNQNGEKASFTGERLSDFQEQQNNNPDNNTTVTANGESSLNMVLLIQVPLKQKNPMTFDDYSYSEGVSTTSCEQECKKDRSDIEAAVIGHGEAEGPYTEINNLDIERDPSFPIRVTVQYYKATSNGVISEQDMEDIRGQIDKTYANADYVGSLVTEGLTTRPTEYEGPKDEPADWWQVFWQRYTGGLFETDRNQKM